MTSFTMFDMSQQVYDFQIGMVPLFGFAIDEYMFIKNIKDNKDLSGKKVIGFTIETEYDSIPSINTVLQLCDRDDIEMIVIELDCSSDDSPNDITDEEDRKMRTMVDVHKVIIRHCFDLSCGDKYEEMENMYNNRLVYIRKHDKRRKNQMNNTNKINKSHINQDTSGSEKLGDVKNMNDEQKVNKSQVVKINNKKPDYDIKVEGKKNTFGDGAIRYSKNKGRFDLIPADVAGSVIDYIAHFYHTTDTKHVSPEELLLALVYGDYTEAIVQIACLKYGNLNSKHECYDYHQTMRSFLMMFKDLAIHFQKGAEKYGERNCEKGIPLWSFRDSAIRHTCQFLLGENDEPHHISAVWNCWMAEWTIMNHPERCGDKQTTRNATTSNK